MPCHAYSRLGLSFISARAACRGPRVSRNSILYSPYHWQADRLGYIMMPPRHREEFSSATDEASTTCTDENGDAYVGEVEFVTLAEFTGHVEHDALPRVKESVCLQYTMYKCLHILCVCVCVCVYTRHICSCVSPLHSPSHPPPRPVSHTPNTHLPLLPSSPSPLSVTLPSASFPFPSVLALVPLDCWC